jgi:hypothetical protein
MQVTSLVATYVARNCVEEDDQACEDEIFLPNKVMGGCGDLEGMIGSDK